MALEPDEGNDVNNRQDEESKELSEVSG